MFNLGPSTPFLGIAASGLVAVCVVTIPVLLSRQGRSSGKHFGSRHKNVVFFLLAAVTFTLWGSSTGHGGPHADGGTVAYTHGGMLRYVSATSYQPHAGASWSHELSVRPPALVGTIALNAVAVMVALFGSRWIAGRTPNKPMHAESPTARVSDGTITPAGR